MLRLPPLPFQLHKRLGQPRRVPVEERLAPEQVDLLGLRPKKVQLLKQRLPLTLDVLPKELALQERPLPGQLLPVPRTLVRELPKQPLADAHPPGQLPLPKPSAMQRGVFATKLRRPRHPDLGRQRPLVLRQLHDRLHKLVQQREHKRHVLLQLRPK